MPTVKGVRLCSGANYEGDRGYVRPWWRIREGNDWLDLPSENLQPVRMTEHQEAALIGLAKNLKQYELEVRYKGKVKKFSAKEIWEALQGPEELRK